MDLKVNVVIDVYKQEIQRLMDENILLKSQLIQMQQEYEEKIKKISEEKNTEE